MVQIRTFLAQLLLFSIFFFFSLASLFAQLNADFSASDTAGCLTVVSNFSDLTTGGTPVSWQWQFFQSGVLVDTRTGQNPGKIFTQPGCYDVVLTVTDAAGNSDSERKNCFVEVFRNPDVDFSIDTAAGCAPATFTFTNLTTPNAASLSGCTWVFRNQRTLSSSSSNVLNPQETFADFGVYDVQLRCTNANGCDTTIQRNAVFEVYPQPQAGFTAVPPSGCTFPIPLTLTNNTNANNATGLSFAWQFTSANVATSTDTTPANVAYSQTGTFPVTLTVTSGDGCSSTRTQNVTVQLQSITADFTISDTTPCLGRTVTFTDASQNANRGTRNWDFGNGVTATGFAPLTSYNAVGNYTITLINRDITGCEDTVQRTVQVLPRPPASFTVTPDSTCDANQAISFQATAPTAVTYLWNFGDNTTSTQISPTHTYGARGTYQVCLTVIDANGCDSVICIPQAVVINSPQADFGSNVNQGCTPLQVNLTDLSNTADPIVSWRWTFGDGSGTGVSIATSTLQNPSFTVTQSGIYDVKLVIETASGCTDSLTRANYIRAGTIPTIDFTVDTNLACVNQILQFQSVQTSPAWNYDWNFGVGGWARRGDAPTFAYPDTGCFDVSLAIEDNGCTDTLTKTDFVCISPPIARFTLSTNQICSVPANVAVVNASVGPITSYRWLLDGNLVSTAANPPPIVLPAGTPPGNYQVKLIVENTNTGCIDSAISNLVVGNPVASFTINNPVICLGTTAQFTNNSQNAVGFIWTLNNGQLSTTRNGAITPQDTGIFDVQLVATDGVSGCSDTLRMNNALRVNGVFADFVTSTSSGCAPLQTTFTDQSQAFQNAAIQSWNWDFGDGNGSTLQNPQHTYTANGNFSVTLIVTDANGCQDSVTRTNLIQATKPTVQFGVLPDTTCRGGTVQFTNQSVGVNLSYRWQFSNDPADTSNLVNPIKTYLDTGAFTIQLIATDANGCTDTSTVPGAVYVEDFAIDFMADRTTGTCPPLTVNFTDLSTGRVDSVVWDFGDGTRSFQRNPSHIYTRPGCFDVMLIGFHPGGCVDTLFRPCYIDIDGPLAQLEADPFNVCLGDTVDFQVIIDSASSVILDPAEGAFLTRTFTGNVSDTLVFKQRYARAGFFSPTVAVTNTRGCLVTRNFPRAVRVVSLPQASFVPNFFSGCTPFTPIFNDNSTPGDTTIVDWRYTFVGTNDTLRGSPDTSYTFFNPGLFTVNLLVTDAFGCVDSASQQLEASPPPRADFVASDSFNCAPAFINFTDRSVGNSIVDWRWIINGDTIDGTQNPGYLFQQDGAYDVTLIAFDINGCTDTLTKPQYIRLRRPTAYVYGDLAGCNPSTLTLFADSSAQYSDTTLAQFFWALSLPGGGLNQANGAPGSAADSITQAYATAGNYPYVLVVEDVFGCRDTLIDSVSIFRLPQPDFTVSDSAGCRPHPVAFSDASVPGDGTLTDWRWTFGTGDSAFVANPNYVFDSAGVFSVKMVVSDDNGCVDSISQTVEAYDLPIPGFTASDTFTCAPAAITFTDQSTNTPVTAWRWDFGDGGTDTTENPVYTYNQDGTYDVELIVTDVNGCVDTLLKSQYIELRHPTAYVYASSPVGCNPIEITFYGDSARVLSDTTLASFTWLVEDHTGLQPPVTTTVDSFEFTYTQAGIFDVSLIVEDVFGCRDTIYRDDYIDITETVTPDPLAIEYVTVRAADSIEISFQRFSDPQFFKTYYIYRQNIAGQYVLIDSIFDALQTVYVDASPGLATEVRSYCYKILVKNSCDQVSPINNTEEHCSVWLSTAAGIDEVTLIWTDYVGWEPIFYEIYRVVDYGIDTSTIELIDVVPGNVTTYLDTNTFCLDPITYRIRAVRDNAPQPVVAWSNVATETPIHLLPSEPVHISVATVEPDSSIRIDWGAYGGYNPDFYVLERSTDGEAWVEIDTFPDTVLTYLDANVNVDLFAYSYRVKVVDTCGDVSPPGRIGRTVLLAGRVESLYPVLRWTSYEKWRNGVLFYRIERFNPVTNQWEEIGITSSDVLSFTDPAGAGESCYRIVAVEAGGNGEVSVSNELCLGIGPRLYFPNAFTPNGDNHNETFSIKGNQMREGMLRIFSRWGQLLYETQDLQAGWDGTYEGRDMPEGVYVFRVTGLGFDGSEISRSGTVTLIR